jgi:hypothetical protein
MKKFDPTQLSYFTGTEKYYQLSDATPFGQTPPLRQNKLQAPAYLTCSFLSLNQTPKYV